MADAATAAAMEAALRAFNTQLWSLYAFGVVVTIMRTYARLKSVGIKGFRGDDFLIWLAILLYTTQTTLAFYAVNYGQGLANNSMTDDQRAALSPESIEYQLRLFGSKVQVVGWTIYVCLIFTLKICVLIFYIRLMEGLSRKYQQRIWIGFGIVGITFGTSIITIYSACQPISKYWQINPDPGNRCQGAVAAPIVWVTFISSVLTDLYLIMIPLPMLWGTRLKLAKKMGATVILGAGVFVLVCSLLKTIFVITDPVNGAQLAGEWGTREAFVSVITTNLPIVFNLLKGWLKPFFGTLLSSTRDTTNKHPSGFRTIGGGDGGTSGSRRRNSTSRHYPSKLSITDSEERIVKDVRMDDMDVGNREPLDMSKGIMVSNEFEITTTRVTTEDRNRPKVIEDNW